MKKKIIAFMLALTSLCVPFQSAFALDFEYRSEAEYSEGAKIFENEYAVVTACQDIKIKSNSRPVEVEGRTYENRVNTSGVNTKIDVEDGESATYRLAYKISAKKDCKVYADVMVGKPHVLFVDRNNTLTAGTSEKEGSGSAALLDSSNMTTCLQADIRAGECAYVGTQGSNDGLLGLTVTEASKITEVETLITLEGENITSPFDIKPEGFGLDEERASVSETGKLAFSALSSYTYALTLETEGKKYEGELKVTEDGTFPDTLSLTLKAADCSFTLKNEKGEPIEKAKVVLNTAVGETPYTYSAVTDEKGKVVFESLPFENYTLICPGFEVPSSFTPSKDKLDVDITAKIPSNLPSADMELFEGDVLVGYKQEGTKKVYYDIQEGIDAAKEGATVYVAPGNYNCQVTVNKSVNILAPMGGVRIVYNQGQGSDNARGFHGDTFLIDGKDINVTIENITIENNAEETLGATANATALSSSVNGSQNNITLKNCDIIATRDTVYTGKSDCNDSWVFEKCRIYGFQDVVCGGGDALLKDCTWIINKNNDARLLVPQCNSEGTTIYIAKDLKIESSVDFDQKAYLGRSWGNSEVSAANSMAVVDGYTDNEGLITDTVFNGFDTSEASKTPDTIAAANWLVRKDKNEPFKTTNSVISSTPEILKEKGSENLWAVEVKKLDNLNSAGFAVYVGDEFKEDILSDTLYTENQENIFALENIKSTYEEVYPCYEIDLEGLGNTKVVLKQGEKEG